MNQRFKIAITVAYSLGAILLIVSGFSAGCRRKEQQLANASKTSGATGEAQQTKTIEGAKIRPLTDSRFEQTKGRLERGKYLAEGVLQCFLCHSDRDWSKPGAPPIPEKKGAGHIWEDTPGLVAPNITPDKETGAGLWTDDMLARAIREGISHDGRVLDPQMFYGSFRRLSDEDLASVIVYLRALKPIYNPLPRTKQETEPTPPTPLTERIPEPDLSTPVRRGAYMAKIGSCLGCHTAFYSPLSPGYFGGGDHVKRGKEEAFSANLTADPSGILSYYDENLFIRTLRTGQVKARKLSPVMPWAAVRNMSDEDLKGIFAYLRTRRPVRHIVDNTEPPSFCPACGQKHGFGDRNEPKKLQPVRVDANTFDAYLGSYRFEDDFVLIIKRDGNRLLIQNGLDGPIYELVAIAENEFTAREIPDVISFVKDARGEVTHLISNVDDVARKFK
jgi:mono/diheme cytochrome c family protein